VLTLIASAMLITDQLHSVLLKDILNIYNITENGSPVLVNKHNMKLMEKSSNEHPNLVEHLIG
jgi:hypothetical protein